MSKSILELTQAQFDSVAKSSETLYLTTNTQRIYKGNKLYADGISLKNLESRTINGKSLSNNVTLSASDIGINISASGSGSWVPRLYGNTNAGTFTSTLNNSSWYRIGNILHMAIWMTGKLSGATGYLTIGNLPYNVVTTSIVGCIPVLYGNSEIAFPWYFQNTHFGIKSASGSAVLAENVLTSTGASIQGAFTAIIEE